MNKSEEQILFTMIDLIVLSIKQVSKDYTYLACAAKVLDLNTDAKLEIAKCLRLCIDLVRWHSKIAVRYKHNDEKINLAADMVEQHIDDVITEML